jgi:SAM-dependent methyltransferase
MYDDAFFNAQEQRSLSSARAVAALVEDLLPVRSVLDIGCGRGAWLKAFLECGADNIVGFDGAYVDRSQLLIPSECFFTADLALPFDITERFDLAISVEVLEHLPHSVAPRLIETLCAAAPAVLFSAAIPGQGGTHHVNERWPEYWEQLFAMNAFVQLDPIRRHVFANPEVASWYKQNVYLYVHRSLLDSNSTLQAERALAEQNDVQIIAKSRLVPLMSVSGLLGELGRSIRRSIQHGLGI